MRVLRKGYGLKALFHDLEKASRGILFLDYDGTLAPFRRERDEAYPYPGVRGLLEEILAGNKTRLVVISGRWTKDLIPLLGLKGQPEMWGSHGWERLRPDGSYSVRPVSEEAVAGLIRADEWAKAKGLSGRCEKKPACVALHWRGLTGGEKAELRAAALEVWEPVTFRSELEIHYFDGGMELRAAGQDKGAAVRAVLAEEDEGAVCAYLGDDLTDEDAFHALEGRGYPILVRPERRDTAAALWLKPPAELLDFLRRWLEVCGAAAPGP